MLSIASGNLNDATDWFWYSGSCGGVPAGNGFAITVVPFTTETYFVRGEGGCVTPGACSFVTVTVLPQVVLDLKLFIQGYYQGNGTMSPAIYNELGAIPPYNPTDVDSVIVELHDVTDACLVIASDTGMLQTDGSLHCEFPCSLNGGNYYIVIRHRSSLETWSSVPIGMSGNTFYDFSTGASKAYCENMIDVNSEGVWSIYSGDLNQDGLINDCDEPIMQNDIQNGINGYFNTDLNGDGFTDVFDDLILTPNRSLNLAACSPCTSSSPVTDICPILGPKIFCGIPSSGTATFSIAAVPGATAYSWSLPAGMNLLSGQGSSSVTIGWTAAAMQTGIVGVLCVSAITPCGLYECCDTIKIVAEPVADAGPDSTICAGSCITLSTPAGGSATSYQWYTLAGWVAIPGGSNTVTVCPSAATCYAVIVSNAGICSDTDTVCISIYTPPTLTWNTILPRECSGDISFHLTGGSPAGGVYHGPGTYADEWFNPGQAQIGVHTLYYVFTDSCGHLDSVANTITVVDCPCNAGYCRNFDDNNLHDWQPNPNAPMVDVQISNVGSQNGAGDYYVLASDLTGMSQLMAEPGYNGRWCCGEFCYDYKVIDDGDPQNVLNLHPVFYIYRNGKGFKFTSSVTVTETDGWHRICAPITNCNPAPVSSLGLWEPLAGTAANDWDPVTNMIDRVAFEIDYNGGDEIAAFDNACFNPTYLSATLEFTDCNTLCANVTSCCGPYTYVWNVPPGASITSGQGSACITGVFPEGDYVLVVSNSAGETVTVTIHKTACCNPCDPSNLIPSLTINTGYNETTNSATGIGQSEMNWVLTGAPASEGLSLPMAPFTIAYGYNGKPTFANSQWISSSLSALTVGNNATGPAFTFEYMFCVCQDDTVHFDFSAGLDDSILVYIDNYAIVFPQGPYNGYGGLDYHQAYFLTSGVHHLRVDLRNLGGSVMGFDISGTISGNHLLKHGTCNPSFMAADAGPDISICRNECATIGAAPVSGMTAYNWFSLPGFVPIPGGSNFITVCPTTNTCYALITTDANGCNDTDTVCVTIRDLGLTCQGTNIVCHGASTGSVCATIACPDPPYSISWTRNGVLFPGPNSLCLTDLTAGTYCITVIPANGSIESCCYTVTEPPAMDLSITVFPPAGCGQTGGFTLIPSGGTANYTLSIEPCPTLGCTYPVNPLGISVSNFPPGSYDFILTDANGCVKTFTAIMPDAPLTVNCQGTNVTCHGGLNGSACVTTNCGTAPFNYSWTKNGNAISTTTSCANGLAAGVYCVTVTDANGITASCCYTVTEPPALSINVIVFDAPTCGGLGSFSFIPGGGVGPYTISTSPCVQNYPCSFFQTMGFSTLQKYPAGDYTIYVTDSNGCIDSIHVTMHEPVPPIISVDAINPLCCGDSGRFVTHINGGTGPYTIEMRISSGGFSTTIQQYSNVSGPLFSSPNAAPAGQYTIVVTDANGCTSSATLDLVDPPCLELHVSFTPPSVDQCDGTITAYGSGGTPFNLFYPTAHVPYNILISQISGNTSTAVYSQSGNVTDVPFYNYGNQLCAGIYVVTIADSNGCTRTDTINLECEWQLSPQAGVFKTTCLVATEDAVISQFAPTTNYSNYPFINVSRWTYSTGPFYNTRALFKFNMASIPSNSVVNATLLLSNCPTCAPNDIHRDLSGLNPWFATPLYGNNSIVSGLSAPWTENTVTWNGAPAANGLTDPGADLGDNTTTNLSVTVTNIIQNISNTGVNNGMMLQLADDPLNPINYYHAINFASRENANAAIRPQLCIDYYASSTTICQGTTVPLQAPVVVGVTYAWYSLPGFVPIGNGNPMNVTPMVSTQYALIATSAGGCKDTNYVMVNVIIDVDDNNPCTQDYCLNGVVHHDPIISCVCPCDSVHHLSPNKVVNGNFSAGNTGFTSDLPNICTCLQGSYCVGNTAKVKCANFLLIPDNTSGTGTGNANYLIVDGRNAAPTIVWQQSVGNIVIGRTYTFSFAVHPNVSGSTDKPSLDVMLGSSVILSVPAVSMVNGMWTTYCTSFTAAANIQSASLRIRQTNPSNLIGYDYGIDDIVFKSCEKNINLDNISYTNVPCYNGSTGSISVSPTGGVSPYTYDWGNGIYTQSISGLSAGTYTVTVTDATGDFNTTSIDILQPDPILPTVSVTTPITCYGGSGCVLVSATGGTPAYSGTGAFCNVNAGTSAYIISDANGCSVTTSVTLTEPSKVEGLISTVAATCGLSNGSATVVASGGTAPYSYSWNGGTTQSSSTLSSIPAGAYYVVITDANGCTGSASTTVAGGGSAPAAPGPVSGPVGVCRNQTGIVYCVNPVAGATSYTWTLPSGVTGSSASNCISVNFPANYGGGFICVTANNGCGSSSATCINAPVLTVKPAVPGSIIGNTIICGPGTHTFSTPLVANATSYNWSVTGTGVAITGGQGTNTISVSVPAGFGQGSLSVYASNCVGNSATRGIYITGIPANSIPITGPTVVCGGTNNVSYSFGTVVGATSYLWTTNTPYISIVSQNGLSCVVNFLPGFTSGNLMVDAITSCGSYQRSVAIKSVPAQPGAITGPYFNLCGAQTVAYSIAAVASATSYNWTTPAGTSILSGQGTTSITVSIPANFSSGNVCVQALNACGSGIFRCLIVSSLPATAGAITGPTTVCKSSVQTYSIATINGANTYSWSITGGASSVPSGTSVSVNYNSATSTSALLKVKGTNACGSGQPAQLNIAVNLACRTSGEEMSQDQLLQIYPNPNRGLFTLQFNSQQEGYRIFRIFDLPGHCLMYKVVDVSAGLNMAEFDLSKEAKGMYLLTIEDQDGTTQPVRINVE
ncbi:MAG TPA: DNRLRE domain-containing protein [Bacteroidia bacterium]|nr:DNRLRE domain-containing protein [Bacteroidia bacterium]